MNSDQNILIDRYCQGSLTEAEAEQLLDHLRAGGDFRQAFVDSIYLHGQLQTLTPADSVAESVCRALTHGDQTMIGVEAAVQSIAKKRRRRRPLVALLAAAAVLLLAFAWHRGNRPPSPVAVAEAVAEASWINGERVAAGQSLLPGDYHLASGSLAVRRPGKYLARIAGETRFAIAADGRLRLDQGRVSIAVESGGNVVMDVPGATLTDVGTSFWVSVTDRTSEVRVLTGEVLLTPTTAPPTQVAAGSSVTYSATAHRVTPLPQISPASLENQNYRRWRSFIETIHADESLLAHYVFDNYTFANTAQNLADPERYHLAETGPSPPLPGPGRWSPVSGLRCYGEEFLWHEEAMPSLSAFTIGCWVKFDDLDRPHGLIRHWINHAAGDYVLRFGGEGKLEFYTKTRENGYVGGPFNGELAANTWTLIMAVYDGSRMRLYVDGTASPTTFEQHGQTYGLHEKFMLCRDNRAINLRGIMDEVFVYRRALSPSEVQQHFEAGRQP